MRAVILAGGRGTRLGKITQKTPKPLIKIGGKPILEYQVLLLGEYGIKDIWILSGHFGRQIEKYFGDGDKWNVKIHHLVEKIPLGTAGAIKQLTGKIKGDFLVLSGDIVTDFDIRSFVQFHKKKRSPVASIIVHPNDHPDDSDLVDIDKNNLIKSFLLKPHPKDLLFHNLSVASVFLLTPKIFKHIKTDVRYDLEKDIFPKILKGKGKLFAYRTAEYIKDVGTPQRLRTVTADFLSGKVSRLNKRNKRAAIFMDRDGVINQEVDQLKKLDEFKLFPFVSRAIKKINSSEYLAIIITNQPMIAKGFMTDGQLDQIHRKLETGLGVAGTKIDAIYWCPHYPESGFVGEISRLKIRCNCRKPKIGLIKRAAKDFNIDLTHSFFIGDSTVDAKCARNADLKFIGVKTGYGLKDARYKINRNLKIANNLLEAVDIVTDKTKVRFYSGVFFVN